MEHGTFGHSLSLSQGAGADLCWWADSSCNFHPHFSSDSDNVAQIEDWGSVCEAVEIQINACAVVSVVETLSLLMCTSSNCLCCIQYQILLHCTACGSFDFAYPWYTSPQHGACWYHWPCTCTPSVCFLQTLTDVAALTRCALYFRADASCWGEGAFTCSAFLLLWQQKYCLRALRCRILQVKDKTAVT